jgi:hypothetical protein
MYSSPIGVIPKPWSNKFFLVNDLSAGLFSPNLWVPKADVHIKLNNLQHFGIILCHVHKMHKWAPVWLFKSDVHGAYQTWPMHLLWQLKQVITFDGQHYMDCCMEFGQHASPKIWCLFMGLVVWITIHKGGVDHLLHYMDDAWSYVLDEQLHFYLPYQAFFPKKTGCITQAMGRDRIST